MKNIVKFTQDFNDNLVDKDTSILEALKILDRVKIKVLFCVDEENRLIGSVTDGDIRRAILSGNKVEDGICMAVHEQPCCVDKDDEVLALKIMHSRQVKAVPLLDENGTILKIFYETYTEKKEEKEAINLPVVIMAGGKGKRLYPYTKILPKPLIPIDDIPISERIINKLSEEGCDNFYMIVNHKKNMIKAYYGDEDVFGHMNVKLNFIDENIPLGTGGGLKLLKDKFKGTFILTNCDILIREDLFNIVSHHEKHKNMITMVCSLKNIEIPYGVVGFSEGGELVSFDEKPQKSFFTNTGFYIVETEVFEYIKDGENIGMPEIMERIKADNKKVGIYPISEKKWLDMGQFDSMESMEQVIKENSEFN